MKTTISAIVSFCFVSIGVFLLAGWFLMPHLPPIPDRPVSAFEFEYWQDNWIGLLLGPVFGALSALSVIRKAKRMRACSTNSSKSES